MSETTNIAEHMSTDQIQVYTLGKFSVVRGEQEIDTKAWGRDKTVQLFQYMVSAHNRGAMHKEQIMDRLWEDYDDRSFKVALHGVNKALEPDRPSRQDPKYIVRNGLTYHLNMNNVWIDAVEMESYISEGNRVLEEQPAEAIELFQRALSLYNGSYLPDRMYEDWTTTERERLQVLALNTYVQLAEMLLKKQPQESIRLCEQAILIDSEWEDAYRTEMQAYLNMGNRPMVIKTYNRCVRILEEEYGLEPLPMTKALLEKVKNL